MPGFLKCSSFHALFDPCPWGGRSPGTDRYPLPPRFCVSRRCGGHKHASQSPASWMSPRKCAFQILIWWFFQVFQIDCLLVKNVLDVWIESLVLIDSEWLFFQTRTSISLGASQLTQKRITLLELPSVAEDGKMKLLMNIFLLYTCIKSFQFWGISSSNDHEGNEDTCLL